MKLVAQGGITNKKIKAQGAAGPQQGDHVWSQEPQQLYYFLSFFFWRIASTAVLTHQQNNQ